MTRRRNYEHDEGQQHVDLGIAQPLVHLIVEEQVDVRREGQPEDEDANDNHLGPRETLDLDLLVSEEDSTHLNVNLRTQEGGNVLRSDRILQLEVVVRIQLRHERRKIEQNLLSEHLVGRQETDRGSAHDAVEREHVGSQVNGDADEHNVLVRLLLQRSIRVGNASELRVGRTTRQHDLNTPNGHSLHW